MDPEPVKSIQRLMGTNVKEHDNGVSRKIG